jgi:hypothetical protein
MRLLVQQQQLLLLQLLLAVRRRQRRCPLPQQPRGSRCRCWGARQRAKRAATRWRGGARRGAAAPALPPGQRHWPLRLHACPSPPRPSCALPPLPGARCRQTPPLQQRWPLLPLLQQLLQLLPPPRSRCRCPGCCTQSWTLRRCAAGPPGCPPPPPPAFFWRTAAPARPLPAPLPPALPPLPTAQPP